MTRSRNTLGELIRVGCDCRPSAVAGHCAVKSHKGRLVGATWLSWLTTNGSASFSPARCKRLFSLGYVLHPCAPRFCRIRLPPSICILSASLFTTYPCPPSTFALYLSSSSFTFRVLSLESHCLDCIPHISPTDHIYFTVSAEIYQDGC